MINNIQQGDCVQLLKNIPDNSVDVCFADPPFNLDKKYETYKDAIEQDEYIQWSSLWLKELWRITKDTGSVFIHNIPKWLVIYSRLLPFENFKHWICWDASSGPMGKSLQPNHYGILYYTKSKRSKFYEIRSPHKRCRSCKKILKDYGGKKNNIHPFGALVSDVWTDIHRCKHNKTRDAHPCQLPVPLLERILLMTTDKGDVICDPFMGTGTTAIAAKRLDRNYIGCELNNNYCEIIRQKINNIQITSNIDNIYFSCYNKRIITLRDNDFYDYDKKEYKNKEFFKNFPANNLFSGIIETPLTYSDEVAAKIKILS